MWYDNEITQGILKKKYLHDGEKSYTDLVNRVASIYSDDIKDKVKEAMLNADLSPAGRTLYGIGYKDKKRLTISNCYIEQNVEDDLESISKLDYNVSRIGSMGGGVGFCVDNIRPKGAIINNSARISDGVAFVMRKINNTGQNVGQWSRNLALMCGINCSHPDIYEFLHIKENDEKLASMNISIKFTDEFMQAVVDDKPYELHFKVKSTGEEFHKTIMAREFFKEFCEVNRDYGDPGCIFIDKVRKHNLVCGYNDYVIDISNPCAEYFANDGNSCLLQSINLYNIVEDKFTDNAHINYDKLKYLVRLSVDMMNQTQDYGYSMQPLDKNRKNIDDWRSIGLGVFALADMFIAMKVKYGSDESIKLVSDIFDVINMTALDESAELAKKYGTYGKYDWNKQKKSPIIKALLLSDEGKKVYNKIKINGLRNSSLISVAPTGTISLFMGKFSGGVEPLFRVGYDRTTHSGEDKNFVFRVFAHSVDDLLKLNNLPNTLTNEEIKKKFPWVVESQDITPIDRIRVQSVMQDYVDNAISSTINLPEGTGAEKIFDIYVNAWKQGLKGITVFVDNCKRGNILGVNKKEPEFKYDSITPISRRGVKEIGGATYRLRTACVDKMYLTVNKTDDGDIFEVFANPSAGCTSNITTVTRLVSMALRSGIKVEEIIRELSAMKCPACQALIRKGEKDIELSCGNAIAKALKLAYSTKETHSKVVEVDNVKEDDTSGLYECPECHHKTLKLEAKCASCSYCGFSRCN